MKCISIVITIIGTITSLTHFSVAQSTAPQKLTWDNIDQVEAYARLKQSDENYQKVTWHSTVLAGHQKAQKEDKPLILWLYFGDPRGNC